MIRTLKCIDCGEFFDHEYVTGAPPQRCHTCRQAWKKKHNAERQKAWRVANPDRAREHWTRNNEKRKADPAFRQYHRDQHIRLKYGITRAELDAMVVAQDNRCAICGGGRNGPGTRLHIDHCHDSKKVRGLLCGKCNTAVGLLDDDPERAEQLAAYLRR